MALTLGTSGKIILNGEEIDLTVDNTEKTISFALKKAQQRFLTQAKFNLSASAACNFFANNEILWQYNPTEKKWVQNFAGYVTTTAGVVKVSSASGAADMVVSLNEQGADQSICVALPTVAKDTALTDDNFMIYKLVITYADGGIVIKDTSRSLGVGRLVKIYGTTGYTTGGISIPLLAKDDFYINEVIINGGSLYKYELVDGKLKVFVVGANNAVTEKSNGQTVDFVIYGMSAQ